MINLSRRQLAQYAVEQMLAKRSPVQLAQRLAAALQASGRQKEAELLLSDIDRELEDRGLVARVRLSSAHTITAEQRSRLTANLKKLIGVKAVIITPQVDKSIIGGVRIETATRRWDKTLNKQLSALKESI